MKSHTPKPRDHRAAPDRPYANLTEIEYKKRGDPDCHVCRDDHKKHPNCPTCGGRGTPWLI